MASRPAKSRPHKWIDQVDPDAPVRHAAIRSIGARWSTVAFFFPRAALHSSEDVEYVHQLRVYTRRADAAIHQFSALLPVKSVARATRRLKRIRQAAGDARDTDVLLDRLRAMDLAVAKIDADQLHGTMIARLQRRREKAQQPIKCTWRDEGARFAGRGHRLTAKIAWSRCDHPEPSLRDFALAQMASTIESWSKSGRQLNSDESLHTFRIAGKRARYAMELFVSAFPESFRDELYPSFQSLQDRLGEINDHVTAIDDCRRWRKKTRSSEERLVLKQLIRFERSQLATRRDAFATWWTPDRAAKLQLGFKQLVESS